MEKMTRKEALEMVLGMEEVKANEVLVEVLEKMLAQVSKPRTSKTKNQKANEEIVERIYEIMVEKNSPMTVAQIMKELGEGFSNQKVSALTKKLKDAGRIVKTEEKGKKAVYSVAD